MEREKEDAIEFLKRKGYGIDPEKAINLRAEKARAQQYQPDERKSKTRTKKWWWWLWPED